MIAAARYWLARLADAAVARREAEAARQELREALYQLGREIVAHRSVRSAWSTAHADVIRLTEQLRQARAELDRRRPS